MRLFLDIIWNNVEPIVLFAHFSIILLLVRIRAMVNRKNYVFNRMLVAQGKNKVFNEIT